MTSLALALLLAAAPVSELIRTCDGGALEQCARLAFIRLDLGELPAAEAAARKACDGKNLLGCVALGQVLRRSAKDGTTQALKLFARACEGKEPAGCLALAADRTDPSSPRHDQAEALRFYERACTLKNASGCASSGARYQEQKEYALAAARFETACDLGDELACGWLGELLAKGEAGVQRDPARAAKLLARGCRTMMKSCNRFRDALSVPCKAGDAASCDAAVTMDRELQRLQQQ